MRLEYSQEDVNYILRGTYTERGVYNWWKRPRKFLDGMTPREMWQHDPQRVYNLAMKLFGPGDAT